MPGFVPGIHVLQRLREEGRWMAGTSSAKTRFALLPGHDDLKNIAEEPRGDGLRRQRGLGLLGDRLKRRRLGDGEIRQHLSVHRDARLRETVDEDAVGHPERTNRGVDALDPERAEGALLALAVTEGILTGLLDRSLGGADG